VTSTPRSKVLPGTASAIAPRTSTIIASSSASAGRTRFIEQALAIMATSSNERNTRVRLAFIQVQTSFAPSKRATAVPASKRVEVARQLLLITVANEARTRKEIT
jgi:hypothetical protein